MNENEKMNQELEKKLPRGVALSWGIIKPPQRGPKRELSVKQIVDTAIEIADKEGLSAVSMNRIASSLGYTTMSLYRYIPSKEDLLLLLQDAVADIPFPTEPETTDWREKMREYVRITISAFQKHPWFGDIPISGVPVTPNQLNFVDKALRTTRELPLNDYEKMSIVLLLSGYARSWGMLLKDMNRALQTGKSKGEFSGQNYGQALKTLVKPDRYPDLYPVLMSGVYTEEDEEKNTVGNDLDFGLERILDGIEHYLNVKKEGV